MEKLTVVIPTYNRSKYLKSAIEGVLNQSFKDFKLIILDNASTDNTPDIVKSFKDRRITYIRNERNIGMISNLNKAIEICETPYLSIPHDDDVMKTEFLEREIRILESDLNVSMVDSNVELICENGITKKDRRFNFFEDKIFESKEYIETALSTNFILILSTAMYRTKILKENNIKFDGENDIEVDNYIWFKLNLLPFKIYWISDPIFKDRDHAMQNSKTLLKFGLNFDLKIVNRIRRFLIDNNLEYLLPNASSFLYHTVMEHTLERLYRGDIKRKNYINDIKIIKSMGIVRRNIDIRLETKRLLANISPKLLKVILDLKRSHSD